MKKMTISKNDACSISVIMPVYNAGKHVYKSIQSVLNQTFTDFEFIIIDDCSTDESWDIIQSFSDSRIHIVRNDKRIGHYPALNSGMRIAKGRYMAMIGAEDISLPDRLWKQFDYLENNHKIVAIGAQFESSGHELPLSYEEICAGLLEDNCVLYSSLLIRSTFLWQSGGYNEQYKDSSDYDLVCRLCLTGKIENLPETCIIRRSNAEKFSHEKDMLKKEYKEDVRQKYQIAFINKNKSPKLPEVCESETGYPDMGRIIGLYIMGDCFNQSYRDKADFLLESILDISHANTPLSIKNGFLGIGSALIYLLRYDFVSGDEDEILESIDTAIYYSVLYYKDNTDFDWQGTLYYLRKRALMPCRINLLTQLKIKKTIISLLDLYKLNMNNLQNAKIEKELDSYCDDNLFKHLISIYRNNENDQQGVCKQKNIIHSDSVSFVIPVRIDSEERLSNLMVIIDQLLPINNAEIIILEADKKSELGNQNFGNRIQYHFVKDEDPVYHRTKYMNKLLRMAKSQIVGIWDADVLLEKEQIEESISQIKEGKAIMSFPFDGFFYDLSPTISNDFRTDRSFQIFKKNEDNLPLSFGTYSVGGAFLVNKDVYCQIGGENETFYGWGAEDNEHVKRVEILGYRIHRSKGALYHLYHPRHNSRYAGLDFELNNLKEFIKVSEMSTGELEAYVKTWNWLIK